MKIWKRFVNIHYCAINIDCSIALLIKGDEDGRMVCQAKKI
jgi:hypothetical protein